jgi:hypothetical protein
MPQQQRITDERTAVARIRRILSPRNVIVFLAILIIGYLVLTPAIYLLTSTFFAGGSFG